MTILIVDDHPIVLKGIHTQMASSFAEARIVDAEGLKEAEQMLNRHKVDILITDLLNDSRHSTQNYTECHR